MDTPSSPSTPTGPAPAAPPAAAPAAVGPADVQQTINELMRSPEYQRGDRAAVDLVQQWYQYKEHGRVLEPELSDRPADLATPPGFDIPDVVRSDASATIRELGLGGAAQPIFEFCLGHAGPPQLPSAYQGLTPEMGEAKLRESEGPYFDRVLDQAHDAVSVLEHLRARAGRPPGELRQFLDRTGAGNDPRVIKFFARLGGRFTATDPALMKSAAQARARR